MIEFFEYLRDGTFINERKINEVEQKKLYKMEHNLKERLEKIKENIHTKVKKQDLKVIEELSHKYSEIINLFNLKSILNSD